MVKYVNSEEGKANFSHFALNIEEMSSKQPHSILNPTNVPSFPTLGLGERGQVASPMPEYISCGVG